MIRDKKVRDAFERLRRHADGHGRSLDECVDIVEEALEEWQPEDQNAKIEKVLEHLEDLGSIKLPEPWKKLKKNLLTGKNPTPSTEWFIRAMQEYADVSTEGNWLGVEEAFDSWKKEQK